MSNDKPEIVPPSEFAQEVTREILRQHGLILKALLKPPVVYDPTPDLIRMWEKGE